MADKDLTDDFDEHELTDMSFDDAWARCDLIGMSTKEIAKAFWEAGEVSRYLTYGKGHAEGVLAGWNNGYSVGLNVSGNSILRHLHSENHKET